MNSEVPSTRSEATKPESQAGLSRPGLLEGVLDFHQALPAYDDPLGLLDALYGFFTETVRVRSCQIILQSFAGDRFRLYRSLPQPAGSDVSVEWSGESPLFHWYRNTYVDHLFLEGPTQRSGERELAEEVRRMFGGYRPSLCFPLMAGVEQIGVLLVGDVFEGQSGSFEARELLCLLAKNLNLSLNRLFLLEELQVTGRLPRGLAHDLRGLLTPVATFLQLAGAVVGRDASLRELHLVAMRNLQAIEDYIRQTRTLGRSAVPALRVGHLDEVIRRAAQLIRPRFEERGVILEVEAVEQVVSLMDEPMMLRLVMNLLTNALAATESGKRVRLLLASTRDVATAGDWLRVEVRDEGRGIRQGQLERLLASPFGSRTADSNGRGSSGMGLSICRRIARMHGGWMTLRSVEGEGTVVEVRLPQKVNL